jgi:hypothetical protein
MSFCRSLQRERHVMQRISFTDRDVTGVLRPGLLRAAWGNTKKAIFLNQLQFAAKNAAKAQGDESLKVVSFAFDRSPESLKSLGLSEPTMIAYLKEFSAAGYLSAPPYARIISVDRAAIEAAETNPPDRPSRSDKGAKSLNFRQECQSLKAKVQKLEEEVQTLKLFVQAFKDYSQIFKLFPEELKLLNFSEVAPQAVAAELSEAPRFLDDSRILERGESIAPANADCDLSHPVLSGEENTSYSQESLYNEGEEKTVSPFFTPERLEELDHFFDQMVDRWLYEERQRYNAEQEGKQRGRRRKQQAEQIGLPLPAEVGPLEMPAEDAPWNWQTMLAIAEVLRKRRYTPKQRISEEKAAKAIFRDYPQLTRAQFLRAWPLVFNEWWLKNNGPGLIEKLLEKNRLQQKIDLMEMVPPEGPQRSTYRGSPSGRGMSAQVSEEINRRNLERLFAAANVSEQCQAVAQ